MGRANSRKRTHHKQLAKNAAKRQLDRMEQAHRRRYRRGAFVVAIVLGASLVGGLFYWGPWKAHPKTAATARPTPTASASPAASTKTGTVTFQGQPPASVACGGQVPAGLTKPKPQFSAPPANAIDPASAYTARFDTSCGTFTVALDPTGAPVATNNFVFLAHKHLYDGTWFQRIVKGFMIQGGDPLGTGSGGPGYQFYTEANPSLTFGGKAGVIAYANSGPNTNGSQFFITVAPQSFLDQSGPYTAFGTVTEGLAVVQEIANLPAQTGAGCASPTEACRTDQAVYINSVTIKAAKAKPSPKPSP